MRTRIIVTFEQSWILNHRKDFNVPPVQHVADFVANDIRSMKVMDVKPTSFVLEPTDDFTGLLVSDMVESSIEKALNISSLDGVCSISVREVEDNPKKTDASKKNPETQEPFKRILDKHKGDSIAEDDDLDSFLDFAVKKDEPDEDVMLGGTGVKPTTKKQQQEKRTLSSLYGEMDSLRAKLSAHVKGQTHAIDSFVSGIFGLKVNDLNKEKRKGPKAVFLFAGPPGVGKTFLAETAAEILKLPFLKLDMSGFSDGQAAVEDFRGINPSYKSASAGQVTSFVDENPKCVLLFDEIEKAHMSIIQLFLQILEGGRLQDVFMEKDVSFKDAIIIMTTNAGRGLYEDTVKRNFSDVSSAAIINALQTDINPLTNTPYFPAAIISRLTQGTIVMFNHLEPYDMCQIVNREIEDRIKSFKGAFGLNIKYTEHLPAAILYSKGGVSDARTLKGAAKKLVNDEILSLFGQFDLGNKENGLDNLKNINISLDYENATEDAKALFQHRKAPNILFFAEKDVLKLLSSRKKKNFTLFASSDLKDAKQVLRGEIDCVVIDATCNERSRAYSPADIEDVDSDGMDLLRYIKEFYEDMPIYLMNTDKINGDTKTFKSFIKYGISDIVDLRKDNEKNFNVALEKICQNALLRNVANMLSMSHKALYFNCAQTITDDKTTADIKLAFLSLKKNILADDSAHILANNMKPNTTFADVIGGDDAKETLKEFIKYLKNPKEFIAKGIRAPRGVLLYGKPGTGKTLLAKAMAGESEVTFIQKNGTEFFKSYVGEGPKAIRDTFKVARKYAPSILFVDEIDTFAKMRTGSEQTHAAEELQNAFLSEMDGFSYDEKRPVFVLAATNYEVDSRNSSTRVLDPAFVRRFDRKIKIELPNTNERAQFIKYYLEKHGIKHIKEETINNLALRSIGKSPADLEMVIELAIRNAKGEQVTDKLLEQALDFDAYGTQRQWKEDTVKKTTYHEIGHTVISWLTGKTPTYVTNISRGNFGGYMLPEVDDDKFEFSKQELLDNICCDMGGRAAEIVYYGKTSGTTTGASSDLRMATEMAKSIVCKYGMDDDSLLVVDDSLLNGELGKTVLAKMNAIVKEQLQRAITLIENNKKAVELLFNALMKSNSLTGKEISEILKGVKKNV